MSSSTASANQKHFKFMFQANIKTVSLALKFPCVVSVIWKRGQKAQQVKERKPIQKGIISFNQTLQIECNMVFDMNKKVFQQKKTKFTILIFSEKGNKQAGQVYLDVAQLLNTKNKTMDFEKALEKCPDKNAKLNFSLQCYMKQEITPDMVSHRSQKTYDIEATLNRQAPANMKPDFKKKKNQALVVDDKGKQQKVQSATKILKVPVNSNEKRNNKAETSLGKRDNNVNMSSYSKVQQQNRVLKQQLRQLKDLQFENENLKRKYEQADKKAESYYKKKFQEMKEEYNELKQKNQQVSALMKKKEQMQLAICECKQTIGKIFNYAIMTGNDRLMEMMEQLQ